jgi:phosphohistidine phosphatase
MNRRLVVMRHAKSSWKEDGQSDHQRSLNGRGRRSAAVVGARLAELDWTPDVVYSSDAARTVETWERMAFPLGADDAPVHFTRDLYLAGLPEIRDLARTWSDDVGTVLVLGHNPGWELMVGALTGIRSTMTTASAALLAGAGATWTEALADSWRLVELIRPRDLPGGDDD